MVTKNCGAPGLIDRATGLKYLDTPVKIHESDMNNIRAQL